MLKLNAEDQTQLRKAILDAYPGAAGLTHLVMAAASNDVSLLSYQNVYTPGMEYTLFQAIEDLNAQGRIADLIGAVRRGNPADTTLADLERKWLRTVGALETIRLEGMVVEELNYQPATDWLKKLQTAFGWVCRVESAMSSNSSTKAFGTGFLVTDDLVLTNYHVLFSRPGVDSPRAVQLRFDAFAGDGGRVVVPDDSQTIEKSPPGGVEWEGKGQPAIDELDFALIRLRDPVGAEQTAAGTQRGHARLESDARATDPQWPVIILEHPRGAPLQICMGAITGGNAERTRLYHTATTQTGSSGSPCLSMELNVVALHNGGRGTHFNTAVPISNIKDTLAVHRIGIG